MSCLRYNVRSSMDAVAMLFTFSLLIPSQLLVFPRQSLQALDDIQPKQPTLSTILCIFPPHSLL